MEKPKTGCILGFDPGGRHSFGWSVVKNGTIPLTIIATGDASNALEAVEAAIERMPKHASVIAAGIDAPLLWSPDDRQVDKELRKAGCVALHLNSLRGACLVQGILAGKILRKKFPGIALTESHPKACDLLLKESGRSWKDFFRLDHAPRLSGHMRDALLSALSAWAMQRRPHGWKNLYGVQDRRKFGFSPLDPVDYWMPRLPA